MFAQLPVLQKLIRQLQRVPYLASKNVYKVAAYFLTSDDKVIEQLCQTILEAKRAIQCCSVCHNWTENTALCSICSSDKRDKSVICVVETWLDLFAVEKAGGYNGVYHVLGGVLCPLDGIGPDNLNIETLLQRVNKSNAVENNVESNKEDIKEVIFATNPTPEGEATANLISSKIKVPLHVSKLASGVPTGSSLEYMDRVTIYKALLGRRPF